MDFVVTDKEVVESYSTLLKADPLSVTDFTEEETLSLAYHWKNVLANERIIIDLPDKKTLVVGDIHGDYTQLQKAFHLLDTNQADILVFDGDVIDRGSEMLECLFYLASRQIQDPEKIKFLRGNHELASINAVYGFRGFCTQTFGSKAYAAFSQCFQQLPYAAILGDWAFVTHGGVPRQKIYFHMMHLELKPKEPVKGEYWELIWNDPDRSINGFATSYRGKHCYKFGKHVFDEFMEFHELDLFIRAHQAYPLGYRWFFDDRLLSVFSSKAGPYRQVTPHFAIAHQGNVELIKCEDIQLE